MNEPETVTHYWEKVEQARLAQDKAFDLWLASRGEDDALREGLWAKWIASRAALDRALSLLRGEMADRTEMMAPKTQNCGAIPSFAGAGPCECAPGHRDAHSYRGRRWR